VSQLRNFAPNKLVRFVWAMDTSLPLHSLRAEMGPACTDEVAGRSKGTDTMPGPPTGRWKRFFVPKNSIKDNISVCYWSSHTLPPCCSLNPPSIFTGKTSLLASYAQRNQLLEAASRLSPPPSPNSSAWTVVCLSAHTSRVGKHGTQSDCLTGRELAVPQM
jgi:hypothetical protein